MAKRSGFWRTRYEISAAGSVIATWDNSSWKTGGEFELDGRHYEVRSNGWGTKFTMTDESGSVLASADRIGRKQWTVEAGGQTYHFERKSFFSSDQELRVAGQPVGSVRQAGKWRTDVAVDLPGVPLAVQIFVMGIVVAIWQVQAAAA
ncbi:hypothetical protein [Actinoplanes sp. TFC3]|uniref:hypothetical protein n=1 Tax=Actinoplanes sp. TFC3 TaxID=1710355 RepID=UPI00083372E6|nr:hypothetical protein [Actinoplanes sp. TFC3]